QAPLARASRFLFNGEHGYDGQPIGEGRVHVPGQGSFAGIHYHNVHYADLSSTVRQRKPFTRIVDRSVCIYFGPSLF
ncbi:hypothetical protein CONPUDRAFT_166665, partial [Coniophora puteana RWD-64-598 SS2]